MAVRNFQEFWIAGARLYIERLQSDGSYGPLIDLGVIQQANPSLTPEIAQLYDADSGQRQIVDEALSSIDETYEVQCNNFNMDNLSLLFLAGEPQDFTRDFEAKAVDHTVFKGRLCKIKDTTLEDSAEWGLATIDGVYARDGSVAADLIESMTSETKTITLAAAAGDLTLIYTASFKFIVTAVNMADVLNAGTYTVVSSSFSGGKTSIVVTETINSDEAFGGGNGGVIRVTGGGGVYAKGTDWDVHSLQRGIIQIKPDGNIDTEDDGELVGISYSVTALTGDRVIYPQQLEGVAKARAYLVFSRDNYDRETVREMEVSISPSGANVQATDYSDMTLTIRVLNDLTATRPAGRLLSYSGTEPSLSAEAESLP